MIPSRIIFFFCFSFLFLTSRGMEFTKNNNDSLKAVIESIFEDLSRQKISPDKKYCALDYKKASEPDVDVFTKSEFILAKIDKAFVLKIMGYFNSFCADCRTEKAEPDLLNKMKSFLANGNYSIELNSISSGEHSPGIVCLIYGNGRYLFFSMGDKS